VLREAVVGRKYENTPKSNKSGFLLICKTGYFYQKYTYYLSTYFFDFIFHDSLTPRGYSRREIFRFYRGFLYEVFESS